MASLRKLVLSVIMVVMVFSVVSGVVAARPLAGQERTEEATAGADDSSVVISFLRQLYLNQLSGSDFPTVEFSYTAHVRPRALALAYVRDTARASNSARSKELRNSYIASKAMTKRFALPLMVVAMMLALLVVSGSARRLGGGDKRVGVPTSGDHHPVMQFLKHLYLQQLASGPSCDTNDPNIPPPPSCHPH
ncbi:hypothetical protein GUJ93_ZPchr0006g42756 [Zizania palustris]|uniref:Transmembrane protein n=1 Tax=Zizania palustris TaxID=103762 RepID=A0A8J5SAT3_ZIZPA|nr:hypothetical protein GUJ93_ZPchr0006g42756 [Zizania palustris]